MAIGKSVPMLDSVARVTGTVPYASNLKLQDMLVGKVFRSSAPHARIIGLDVSAAEQLPGVAAIVTAADFAGDDTPNLHFGTTRTFLGRRQVCSLRGSLRCKCFMLVTTGQLGNQCLTVVGVPDCAVPIFSLPTVPKIGRTSVRLPQQGNQGWG